MGLSKDGSFFCFQAFAHNYAKKIEGGLRIDALKGELAEARKLLRKLEEIKTAWVLRRTKDNTIASQMPKKVDQVVFCQPSEPQIRVLKALWDSEDMSYLLKALKKCDCGSERKGSSCCYEVRLF